MSYAQQLQDAARKRRITIDGLDERGIAIELLKALGVNPAGACSSIRKDSIESQADVYLVARALHEVEEADRKAANADAFATVKPSANPQRTDAQTTVQPAQRTDAFDAEDEARANMIAEGASAWARGTTRADEVATAQRAKARQVHARTSERRGDVAAPHMPNKRRVDMSDPEQAAEENARIAGANAWRGSIEATAPRAKTEPAPKADASSMDAEAKAEQEMRRAGAAAWRDTTPDSDDVEGEE